MARTRIQMRYTFSEALLISRKCGRLWYKMDEEINEDLEKTGFIETPCLNEVKWMTECAVDSCNMAAFDTRVTRYCCIIIHQIHKTLPPCI